MPVVQGFEDDVAVALPVSTSCAGYSRRITRPDGTCMPTFANRGLQQGVVHIGNVVCRFNRKKSQMYRMQTEK
ncbi:hypothetical protein [Chitinophaga rhizosphaerae]|uniref:hypothetical protein n=1 Tax=Chitinophaga rhizosphaerae TaxID=1864947 RepID=UPI000F801D9E|nr:hypothetical protein [Chitinophaga rhizosphaerae]